MNKIIGSIENHISGGIIIMITAETIINIKACKEDERRQHRWRSTEEDKEEEHEKEEEK